MSEIEKMYELANVQPQYKKRIECKEGHQVGQPCGKCPCIDCDKSVFEDVMPSFTAEKQIAILCWIVNLKGNVTFNNEPKDITPKRLQEILAWAVNQYWAGLTDAERTQIKEILK